MARIRYFSVGSSSPSTEPLCDNSQWITNVVRPRSSASSPHILYHRAEWKGERELERRSCHHGIDMGCEIPAYARTARPILSLSLSHSLSPAPHPTALLVPPHRQLLCMPWKTFLHTHTQAQSSQLQGQKRTFARLARLARLHPDTIRRQPPAANKNS